MGAAQAASWKEARITGDPTIDFSTRVRECRRRYSSDNCTLRVAVSREREGGEGEGKRSGYSRSAQVRPDKLMMGLDRRNSLLQLRAHEAQSNRQKKLISRSLVEY